MKRTCISKHGRIRTRPKFKTLPEEERDAFKTLYKKQIKRNRHLRKDGRAYIQVNPGFKERVAVEAKYLRKADKKHEKMAKKETVVKDKDGSEIIARKKKNGNGNTYVRRKDGKEIGYATRDEFIAAKGQQKESYSMKPLSRYILEKLSE